MIIVKRTTSDNLDFQNLVAQLDQDLALKNGEENAFFAQYNTINYLETVVVAYDQNEPVGCGAIKKYEPGIVEIKRMYVTMDQRGKGIAGKVLGELQNWAKELNYSKCILETGDKMKEAIGLYTKHNFEIIPNYGQYANVKSSICFEKKL